MQAIDLGIERTPGIRGGRPCIAGTGVSVMRVVIYHQLGFTPEQISAKYGHISPTQVRTALSFYDANKAEIDADITDEDAAFEQIEQQLRKPSGESK